MARSVSALLQELTEGYLAVHQTREDAFWVDYMHLSDDPDAASKALGEATKSWHAFMQDPVRLEEVESALLQATDHDDVIDLQGWKKMFASNRIADPSARAMFAEIVDAETALLRRRKTFESGLTEPATGERKRLALRDLMNIAFADPSEARRRAAHEGMLEIEWYVFSAGLLEIIPMRNAFARTLGCEDFYDYRVRLIEGITKRELFAILDPLAAAVAPRSHASIEAYIAEHGESIREPWNVSFHTKGNKAEMFDPYFPLHDALARWGRTYQGLGLTYKGATLTLDLLNRPGKHGNGFMHAPRLRFGEDGKRPPARINFCANATVGQVNSGMETTKTLLHECGHAVHLANPEVRSPVHATEYPPMGTAFLETQSMFLDAYVVDPVWRAKYARDRAGNPMPEEMILAAYADDKRMRAFGVMNGLATAICERDLYEMPDEARTPDRVIEATRRKERELTGLTCAMRPLGAVPHVLPNDSAANYHGYALAAAAGAQMREHIVARDGFLVDNPRVGADLVENFWRHGSRVTLNEAIRAYTGSDFSGDAFVRECTVDVDDAVREARQAIRALPRDSGIPLDDVDLKAHIRVMHGRETITTNGLGFARMCADWDRWIQDMETPYNDLK